MKITLIRPSVMGTGILLSPSLYDYAMDMGKGIREPVASVC